MRITIFIALAVMGVALFFVSMRATSVDEYYVTDSGISLQTSAQDLRMDLYTDLSDGIYDVHFTDLDRMDWVLTRIRFRDGHARVRIDEQMTTPVTVLLVDAITDEQHYFEIIFNSSE